MREKLLAGGGLAAALASTTCCVLPVVLAALGVGGALTSTLAALGPYRVLFRVVAIALLGAGFWLVYGRSDASSTPAIKLTLWIGAALMAIVLTSGLWAPFVT